MNLKVFPLGSLQTNCYILYKENKNAIVFDPGCGMEAIDFIDENRLKVIGIFLTHGHFDHIGTVKALKDRFVNSKVYIHKEDNIKLIDNHENQSIKYNFHIPTQVEADIKFFDDEVINVDGIKIEIITTPGHTKGGVCYIVDDYYMFTGDTLFKLDVGRTDLDGGDYNELLQSLKKLKSLNRDYIIYPGHGESTTLFFENKNNIYMKNL